jgi:gamma-glutamyltranspeptidase / glutathione hydrolase
MQDRYGMQLKFVANMVDYGMNVQAALEQSRFTKGTFEGCDVQMENTIPQSVRDESSAGTGLNCLSHFPSRWGKGKRW